MKKKCMSCCFDLVLVGGLLLAGLARGAVNTWTGTGTGDWFDETRWSQGHFPADSEEVILNAGANVILSNSTALLQSFTMNSSAKLTMTNWTTALQAVDVTLNSGSLATIYAAGPFVNNTMSNRVMIVCSNLTMQTGTVIEVSGRGYAGGGATVSTDGHGPSGGFASAGGEAYHSTGASHGGAGGANLRWGTINHIYAKPLSYGSASSPEAAGSGGGTAVSAAWPGGAGGGAVRIIADGTVTINGNIKANGVAGISHGGGGSGGSVWITCRTFEGTSSSATIEAFGGNAEACGGGGRIAIQYNTDVQPSTLGVRLDVRPGTVSKAGGYGMGPADPGTLWLPDTRFLSTTISKLRGQIVIPGFTAWSPASLTIDDCWVRFPSDGFALNVAGDMVVQGASGRYDVGGSTYQVGVVNFHRPLSVTVPVLNVGGSLSLKTGGKLGVFSAPTPTNSLEYYGAWVNVAGNMSVGSNSWVYPYSHSTNGASPRFSMKNLAVAATGGFDADYKGYGVRINYSMAGMGPGGGFGTASNYTGASYGGFGGGTNFTTIRAPYGSAAYPLDPGSSGGMFKAYSVPGSGGGAIRIEAVGRVDLEGELMANGYRSWTYQSLNGATHGSGGGGSGGGIYVACRIFSGQGKLSARGGDTWRGGGCGGGGRIAVWRTRDEFVGSVDVSGGTLDAVSSYNTYQAAAFPGALGTIYWGDVPPVGSLISLR